MLCAFDGKKFKYIWSLSEISDLLMPDTVLTIIIFIEKNTAWKIHEIYHVQKRNDGQKVS